MRTNGRTMLIECVFRDITIAQLLVNLGQIKSEDNDGQTALDHKCMESTSYAEIINIK